MNARTDVHASRADYVAAIAAQRGYELTREGTGFRLARDGKFKVYQSATGCLTALMTGTNLPNKRVRAVDEPKPEPKIVPAAEPDPAPAPEPEPTPAPAPPPSYPLSGYTLTPGDRPEGGWWLGHGGACMWFPTAARAEQAATSGEFISKMWGPGKTTK